MAASERRRYRSDAELRQQRKELERQWDAQHRRLQRQRERDNDVERAARIERLIQEYRTQDSKSTGQPKKRRA
jgi:hypothetical protein